MRLGIAIAFACAIVGLPVAIGLLFLCFGRKAPAKDGPDADPYLAEQVRRALHPEAESTNFHAKADGR